MDWTKAKNILIAALLATNLLLLGIMVYGNTKVSAEDAIFLKNTIAVLEARNIVVVAELPRKSIRMPVLTVEYDNDDAELIKMQLMSQEALPISEMTEASARNLAESFIEKCGLMTKNVRYEGIKENKGIYTVSYSDAINGIAIEDSYMNCIIKDGKVEAINRLWLKPVAFGKTKKRIIPIAQALIKFMSENKDNSKITIGKIELVYWLDSVNLGVESLVSDTAFPAWKIVYNGGQIAHINAFE